MFPSNPEPTLPLDASHSEAIRLLSQQLGLIYENQPNLREAVMALYAPILQQALCEPSHNTASSSAPTFDHDSIKQMQDVLAFLQSQQPEQFSADKEIPETDPEGIKQHSLTDDLCLNSKEAFLSLSRLLGCLGGSNMRLVEIAAAMKQNLAQHLPELDNILAKAYEWIPDAHHISASVWTKLAQEIDLLVGLPGSFFDKVAVVQQRGVALKDASALALSRVYDDARYVWSVNESPHPSGRLWDLGLLILSNILLTISMTTWSAAVVCSSHAGQPARA